jgi:hypothetical protein
MKNIKLHVCMTGHHLEGNYTNIKSLLDRLRDLKSHVALECHIIFKNNEIPYYSDRVLPDNIKEKLRKDGHENVNFVSYESEFIKYGGTHVPRSRSPSSLTIQHEPLREFIILQSVPDNEFIFKTRTDIHVDDHFIELFLDPNFYDSLKTKESPNTVFEYKIWNSLIGPSNVFEFTDYFFLGRVKEIKKTLIKNHAESERLCRHPIASSDHVVFTEKLQYIKPLLPLIEERNIRNVNSDFYWDIIKSNFEVTYIAEGNDPRRPVLDRNR